MKQLVMHMFQSCIVLVTICFSNLGHPQSYTVSFSMIDSNKQPVINAVIQLIGQNTQPQVAVERTFELVQKGKQFIPLVLPVLKGSPVSFPNYDDIQHHVYSFSGVKKI